MAAPLFRAAFFGLAAVNSVAGFAAQAALSRRSELAMAPHPFAPLQIPSPRGVPDLSSRLKGAALNFFARQSSLPVRLPADDVMLALVSPEAFWLLREWRRQTFGEQESMRRVLDGAKQHIRKMAGVHSVLRGATVSVRSKGLWSTFHKAVVRHKAVQDVLALRVVVRGDEETVYEALEALRGAYPSVGAGRFKDYVAFPKPNGYQGLHDTLLLPSGQAFEVQIRTERMHAQAEVGTAAHRRYKQTPTLLARQALSGMRWPLSSHSALSHATSLAMGAQ